MEDDVNTVNKRTHSPALESDATKTTETENDHVNKSVGESDPSNSEDSRTKTLEFLKIEDPKAQSKPVVVTDTVDKTLLHKKLDKHKDVGQTEKVESVKNEPKGKGRKKVAIEQPPSDWSARASIMRLFGPKKVDKEKLEKEANLKLQAEKEKKKKEAEKRHHEREARKLKSFEKLKQQARLRQEANAIMVKTPDEYWSRASIPKESQEEKEAGKAKRLKETEAHEVESLDREEYTTKKPEEDGSDTPQTPDDIFTKHFVSKSVKSSDPPNSAQDRTTLEFIKMEDPNSNSKEVEITDTLDKELVRHKENEKVESAKNEPEDKELKKMEAKVDENTLKEAEERKPERSARKVKILESFIDASMLLKYNKSVRRTRSEKKEGNSNELSLEDEKKKAIREAWLETRSLEMLRRKEEKVAMVLPDDIFMNDSNSEIEVSKSVPSADPPNSTLYKRKTTLEFIKMEDPKVNSKRLEITDTVEKKLIMHKENGSTENLERMNH